MECQPRHLRFLTDVTFKTSSEYVYTSISNFFAHGHFPPAWKRATVIGIHKSGKKTNILDSYRPISLLNTLGKVYERLPLSRFLKVVSENKIISIEQFGFRAKHSCTDQVLCFYLILLR